MIGHAPSQVSLALTCRKLAFLATSLELALSPFSARFAGFLPVSCFDVPDLLNQLKPWMPASLRLCGHCLTYRPTDSAYWKSLPGFAKNDFWAKQTGWKFENAGWRKQTHDICPSCHENCRLSDYIDCDGCRALGRIGDVDWGQVTNFQHNHSAPTLPTRLQGAV